MREDAIRSFFRRVCFGGNDNVDVDVRRSRSNEGLFEDGGDGGRIGREEKSQRRESGYKARE